MNFRHRAHGGAWVAVGGFLVNRNGWGKPLNHIHRRLLHLPQKQARIGGKALHITPLALGVNSIKGQRAFAAAGKAGYHHQLVTRQLNVNILQIVLSGPFYVNIFLLCHILYTPLFLHYHILLVLLYHLLYHRNKVILPNPN